jgi:hypothetical protein
MERNSRSSSPPTSNRFTGFATGLLSTGFDGDDDDDAEREETIDLSLGMHSD